MTIIRRPDVGRIAVGAAAGAIVIDGDPLSDPSLVDLPDRIRPVIKAGVVVTNTL